MTRYCHPVMSLRHVGSALHFPMLTVKNTIPSLNSRLIRPGSTRRYASQGFNAAQEKAVTFPADKSLQVLAGPGAGKTHVLTSRIAYLLSSGVEPQDIIAVTFTRRAAHELSSRLASKLGHVGQKVVLGTFHSICHDLVKRNADLLGLAHNYSLVDADEQVEIVAQLIHTYGIQVYGMKARSIVKKIRAYKSKHILDTGAFSQSQPEDYLQHDFLVQLLNLYNKELRATECLDYEDLIFYGLKLVTQHPEVIQHVKHVLVDEFQDSSRIQYQLAKAIAQGSENKALTVVGDPDQSIYGWRQADYGNFARMNKDFAPEHVVLQVNYRSSEPIVRSARAMLSQVPRAAYDVSHEQTAQHGYGVPVGIRRMGSRYEEASAIAKQIKLLMEQAEGSLTYDDFVVFFRQNKDMTIFGYHLESHGIPHRVIQSDSIFDRREIGDFVCFVQAALDLENDEAFARALTVPSCDCLSRLAYDTLRTSAQESGQSLYQASREVISSGLWTQDKPHDERRLKFLLELLEKQQRDLDSEMSLKDFFTRLANDVRLMDHFESAFLEQIESCRNSLEKLLNMAAHYDKDSRAGKIGEAKLGDHLRRFIGGASSDSIDYAPKVTLSTIHRAKGLEWSVVFIPGCNKDAFPSTFSKDMDTVAEDARVLYVAMTRARVACFISYVQSEKSKRSALSPFLRKAHKLKPELFHSWATEFDRALTLRILGREDQQDTAHYMLDDEPSDWHIENEAELLIQQRIEQIPDDDDEYHPDITLFDQQLDKAIQALQELWTSDSDGPRAYVSNEPEPYVLVSHDQ